MGTGVFDNILYENNFVTNDMKKIFNEDNIISSWIKTELALAKAESELSIIPKDSFDKIKEKAKLENIDFEYLKKQIVITGHPFMPFVRALSRACGDSGSFVHWGSTTQDIMDTSLVLIIRQASKIIEDKIKKLNKTLYSLAKEEKYTLIIGRTNAQQALPMSLGMKFKVYYNELNRVDNRLQNLKKDLFSAQFSGACGTLSSLGENAIKVREKFHEILKLNEINCHWFNSRDNFFQLISIMTSLSAITGKIGNEIYNLQRVEINELIENDGKDSVGSTAMPHKNNPFKSMQLVTLFKLMKSVQTEACEMLLSEHERDARILSLDYNIISKAFCTTDKSLSIAIDVLENLFINKDKMLENLNLLNGLIYTERIMMKLAPKIGRQKAHDIVHELSQDAIKNDKNIKDIINEIDLIKENFNKEDIQNLINPTNYLGITEEMV